VPIRSMLVSKWRESKDEGTLNCIILIMIFSLYLFLVNNIQNNKGLRSVGAFREGYVVRKGTLDRPRSASRNSA